MRGVCTRPRARIRTLGFSRRFFHPRRVLLSDAMHPSRCPRGLPDARAWHARVDGDPVFVRAGAPL